MTDPKGIRDDHGKSQAIAQFQSICSMVTALAKARRKDDQDAIEGAERAIQEDALSVQVRSGWYAPGDRNADTKPEEFEILLCTGGPAVRIVGKLSQDAEPETASIEYQDWFVPWTAWQPRSPGNVERKLLEYARCFYFGE